MSTTTIEEPISDLAVAPGEFLQEEIEARDMTQRELAARMGRPEQVISEIVHGRKAITAETALQLELVLGITAQFWLNLESRYRLVLVRGTEQAALEPEVQLLDQFPLGFMRKCGWIETPRKSPALVHEVRRFFGVASLSSVFESEALGRRYRVTPGSSVETGALAAWLRAGELEAEQIATNEYDPGSFRAVLAEIRRRTPEDSPDVLHAIQRMCAEVGVVFVLTPHPPNVGANGCTRWLSPDRALIQVNLKYRWVDVFWFTFFHEAGHVLERKAGTTFVQGHEEAADERQADAFAADFLIPPDQWSAFVSAGDFNAISVADYARRIRIHPGIVVSRLQHEARIPHNTLNKLRSRWAWDGGSHN